MELDDGQDDEGPVFAWLPPEDRLWRHPSEVGRPPAAPGRPHPAARTWTVAILAGVVGALLASGVGLASGAFTGRTVIEPVASPSAPGTVALDTSSAGGSWESVADAVAPSVVAVRVAGSAGPQSVSGVVFGSGAHSSYVITSADAFSGATRIRVTFDGGPTVPGRLVGLDVGTGVAVVSVPVGHRPVAAYGSVAQLHVADLVLAVGARSYGSPSLSAPGVLSSVASMVTAVGGQHSDMMAVSGTTVPDVADGGALVDDAGQVVGIASDVTSTDPAEQDLAWGVPVDVALHDAQAILAGRRPADASLGILAASDLSTGAARSLGVAGGAQLGTVAPGSPAGRSGLDGDDIVTSFDGRPVLSSGMLVSDLSTLSAGAGVRLGYLDHGAHRTATLVASG